MKKFNVIKKGVLSLFVLGFVFTSCSNNEEATETEDLTQDTIEVKRSAEIDQIDNILGDIIIDAYEEQEATADRGGVTTDASDNTFYAKDIPECVTIT
ncbi:MAG: hypothetical protein KDD26_06190, partial [Winogradskyella sp.]|nr:hypothetical protein [Winogradskyella sp.]